MSRHSRLAHKYARTLFNVVELDMFEDALGQLSVINELMLKNKDLEASFGSPLFSNGEKEKVVDVIGDVLETTAEVRKYLKYLVVEGKAVILPEILKIAVTMYMEKRRRTQATVASPVDFTPELESRLKEALERVTSKDVDLEYVKDPSLLGGFVVKIGSTMYDSSLKGQLRLLKDELIKG
jgi:ATP synthase F1 delta subunit